MNRTNKNLKENTDVYTLSTKSLKPNSPLTSLHSDRSAECHNCAKFTDNLTHTYTCTCMVFYDEKDLGI